MTRRLSISISLDGTIAAEASGTPGPECLTALDQLRALLGAEVADSKPTPEFSAPSTSTSKSLRAEDDLPLEDHA
jgi:hypothetical protein